MHIKQYGYDKVLEPLIRDLVYLETKGVFVQGLGSYVKGTILYVSADNLGAHSLAGYQESFNVEKCCRFCLANRVDIQKYDVRSGTFTLRTPTLFDEAVNVLKTTDASCVDGLKKDCPLRRLAHFHPAKGFPPDFLHDLLEGIVPVELCMCLSDLIAKKYFTLNDLNERIGSFPFQFYDKTNRPQTVPANFSKKGTIGGNGHENWALLRFLPLLIGHRILEREKTWSVILELKDIVELLSSHSFTTESLCYLQAEISDHRQLLLETFPGTKLRPKHHYLEHYPVLIKKFGPLIEFWTIRFEAKHSFFKKVVHNTGNFKNILHTLATRHQLTLAYYLEMPTIFKPSIETGQVSVVSVGILDVAIREALWNKYQDLDCVSLTSTAYLNGTKYSKGVVLSVGQTSGLPDFGTVLEICVVDGCISFIIELFTAAFLDHLRCFQLAKRDPAVTVVVDPDSLNDYTPLAAYLVEGKLLVTPRTFMLH